MQGIAHSSKRAPQPPEPPLQQSTAGSGRQAEGSPRVAELQQSGLSFAKKPAKKK